MSNDVMEAGNTKGWQYKMVMDWKSELDEYNVRCSDVRISIRESKVIEMILIIIQYVADNESTIASHYRYELNGKLNCLFYELYNLEKRHGKYHTELRVCSCGRTIKGSRL